jgi:hypothetical protein
VTVPLEPRQSLAARKEVIGMSKRNRLNAAIATAFAIGAVAASMPAAGSAQGQPAGVNVATVEPGGGGH